MHEQSNEHRHPELEQRVAEQEDLLRAAFTARCADVIREVRALAHP